MNVFYLFATKDGMFVKVLKTLKFRKTKKMEYASYWTSKKSIKTWENYARARYPDVKIVEAVFVLRETTE